MEAGQGHFRSAPGLRKLRDAQLMQLLVIPINIVGVILTVLLRGTASPVDFSVMGWAISFLVAVVPLWFLTGLITEAGNCRFGYRVGLTLVAALVIRVFLGCLSYLVLQAATSIQAGKYGVSVRGSRVRLRDYARRIEELELEGIPDGSRVAALPLEVAASERELGP